MYWRAAPIIVLLAVSLMLAACDGGGGENSAASSPTPAGTQDATASVEPLACPPQPEPEEMPSMRAFAQQVQAALSSQDADFFLSRRTEREVTCTADDIKDTNSPCAGKEEGTSLKGMLVGTWLVDEFVLGTEDEFRQFLDGNLGSPDKPGLSLYALAYLDHGKFIVMTTTTGERERPTDAWLMFFTSVDDDWQLAQLLWVHPNSIGDWLSEEALSTAWGQCTYWERWGISGSLGGQ